MRRAALALAACAVLAGCGGGSEQEAAPASPEVARDVRAMFASYTAAMGREDFGAACTHLTEGSIAALAADVDKVAPGSKSCEELLERLYGEAGSETRRDLQELVRNVEVLGVRATDRADTVIVEWSAAVRGRKVSIRQPAVEEDGDWQLVAQPSLAG